MSINNNIQSTYQNYINNQKQQQTAASASAKSIQNAQIRNYLEKSNNLMNQFNQLDEFVLSKTKPQPKGFFGKIKEAFSNAFHK